MKLDTNAAAAVLVLLDEAQTLSREGPAVVLSFSNESDAACAFHLLGAIRHVLPAWRGSNQPGRAGFPLGD